MFSYERVRVQLQEKGIVIEEGGSIGTLCYRINFFQIINMGRLSYSTEQAEEEVAGCLELSSTAS
jgi:hypothetical protein